MENQALYARNVNENPCNMCMPLGAILPFKGMEQAMVIIHGSQGCSTYMRRHIAEHFNEPIDVASSSLNEKGTIYGGENNLKKGLDNMIRLYQPKIIGILTTCLAETIGEDIDRIGAGYLRERGMEGFPLVTVPTPGYGGSHTEGYWQAVRQIIVRLATETRRHKRINVIVPNLSPADLREIKRILTLMRVEYIMIPDFSDTLDAPFSRPYRKIPDGGTKLAEVAAMAGAAATIQMGMTVDEEISPGRYLESEFGVPLYNVPIPIGIEATDRLVNLLRQLTGNPVPDDLTRERGRLQDAMIDAHKHNSWGRAAIFGEPELVYAITRLCRENGVKPLVVATGSANSRLEELLGREGSRFTLEETDFLKETDFVHIRRASREKKVNLAIGNSDGRYLTEREGIPLVRIGFPIHDRMGGQRLLSVGYTGSTMFLDRITNTLLEHRYTGYRKRMYEEHYLPSANNG